MLNRALLRTLCAFALLLAGAVSHAAPLTVFAASSLKEALDEAGRAYERETHQSIRASYAASSALARQIEQGAPADVFLSADLDWMNYLDTRGLIVRASRGNLLGNRLVLVVPRDSRAAPLVLARGVDLRPLLGNGRLAVALTASVPAGKYARDAFESFGIWATLKPRLAEAENVRAALMLVARGETPAGVVYASDARAEPGVRVLALFPSDSHTPIVYPVARVSASSHPAAAPFLRWLEGPRSRAIFARHGFLLLR